MGAEWVKGGGCKNWGAQLVLIIHPSMGAFARAHGLKIDFAMAFIVFAAKGILKYTGENSTLSLLKVNSLSHDVAKYRRPIIGYSSQWVGNFTPIENLAFADVKCSHF